MRLCSYFSSHLHHVSTHPKSRETPLCGQLRARIRATGPITVAEYMKEALLNPTSGYYIHHDMLGQHGDFATSPEISQLFGEVRRNIVLLLAIGKLLYYLEIGLF